MPQLESEREVLAAICAHGGVMTRKRLRRLSDSGLVGTKCQCHEKGKSGSETFFPAGTTERVLVIGKMCGWKTRKSDWIKWQLWWNGYEAEEEFWRKYLEKTAAWYDTTISTLDKYLYGNHRYDLTDEGFMEFGRARNARIRDALFRQLRKRVIKRNWDTALRMLFDIPTGRFRRWTEYETTEPELKIDKGTLDKTLGIERARRDRLAEAGPWLEGDIDDTLATLSRNLKTTKLVEVFHATDNGGLVQAREELRSIFEIVSCVSGPLEYAFGNHAFGFRVMARIAKLAGHRLQALFVLMWPILKKAPGAQKNINELLRVLPEARKLRDAYAFIRAKSHEEPALARIFTRRRIKAALTSRTEMQCLVMELNKYALGCEK